MLLGTFLAACFTSTIRALGDEGLPTIQILFFRSVFALIFFLPWVYKNYGFSLPKTNIIKVHALRGFLGFLAMLLWFYPIMKIDLSIAVSVSFLAPIFTAIFGQIFIKDTIHRKSIFALIIGFIGVLVVLRPWQAIDTLPSGFYIFAASMVASTVLWGACNVIIKHAGKFDRSEITTFYNPFFMLIPSAIISYFYWVDVSAMGWVYAILLGILSNLMQIVVARAFALSSFNYTLPFDFFRLIFVTIMGYILFSQGIDIFTIAGGGIIFISAIYSTRNL